MLTEVVIYVKFQTPQNNQGQVYAFQKLSKALNFSDSQTSKGTLITTILKTAPKWLSSFCQFRKINIFQT